MRHLVLLASLVLGRAAGMAAPLAAQADTLARLDSAVGKPPDCRAALRAFTGAIAVDTAALLRCTGRTLAPALAAAAARGADSALLERAALQEGTARFKAGQASGRPSDYAQALEYLLLADRLASSEQSRFLAAVAAFQLADAALRRSKAPGGTCADARLAEHYLRLTGALLPRRSAEPGMPVSPEFERQVAARCR